MAMPKLKWPQAPQRPPLRAILGGLAHKTTRRKAHSGLYTLLVIGVLILVNVLGQRFPWRADLTISKEFSLAPQTIEVLEKLPGEVKAIGFFGEGDGGTRSYMEDMFKEYELRSKGKFTWQIVDPADEPSLIQKYEINYSGVTLLTYKEKQEKLDQWDLMGGYAMDGRPQINGEQALTNAIIRLTADRTPKFYFLEGHGERILGGWQDQLRKEGYTYDSFNFASRPEFPTDADGLVIAGPTRDLTERELEAIDKWTDEKGGRLVVMVDPGVSLPNLERWLDERWGLELRNDVVIDPERNYMYDSASPVPSYRYHSITSRIDGARLAMVMPRARSILAPEAKDGFEISPLLVSSSEAWGETTLKGQAVKEDGDTKGPLTMAVAMTRNKVEKSENQPEKPEARLVLIGSSSFAHGEVLEVQGNLDFIMAAAGWLADRGESVTIRAREAFKVPMFFTSDQAVWILVGTVVVLPLLFLATGGLVWWRRRYL